MNIIGESALSYSLNIVQVVGDGRTVASLLYNVFCLIKLLQNQIAPLVEDFESKLIKVH